MSAEANKALVRPFYAEVDKGSQAPGRSTRTCRASRRRNATWVSRGRRPAPTSSLLRIAERLGQGRNVVTIACDSGLKYLSTDLYSSGP